MAGVATPPCDAHATVGRTPKRRTHQSGTDIDEPPRAGRGVSAGAAGGSRAEASEQPPDAASGVAWNAECPARRHRDPVAGLPPKSLLALRLANKNQRRRPVVYPCFAVEQLPLTAVPLSAQIVRALEHQDALFVGLDPTMDESVLVRHRVGCRHYGVKVISHKSPTQAAKDVLHYCTKSEKRLLRTRSHS